MKSLILRDEEVRSLLDTGRVVVVRAMKPQPPKEFYRSLGKTATGWVWSNMHHANPFEPECCHEVPCPLGVPGERRWVREAWQLFDPDADDIDPARFGRRAPYSGIVGNRPIHWTACYRADGPLRDDKHGPAKWRSSATMPHWASRLTIEIKSVAVEQRDEWCWIVEIK